VRRVRRWFCRYQQDTDTFLPQTFVNTMIVPVDSLSAFVDLTRIRMRHSRFFSFNCFCSIRFHTNILLASSLFLFFLSFSNHSNPFPAISFLLPLSKEGIHQSHPNSCLTLFNFPPRPESSRYIAPGSDRPTGPPESYSVVTVGCEIGEKFEKGPLRG